jgi:hypothetical protein
VALNPTVPFSSGGIVKGCMSKTESKIFLTHITQTDTILRLDSGSKKKQEDTFGTAIVLTIRNTSQPRYCG